jgi:hypothetical protein
MCELNEWSIVTGSRQRHRLQLDIGRLIEAGHGNMATV